MSNAAATQFYIDADKGKLLAAYLQHLGTDLSHVPEGRWHKIHCVFPENHANEDRTPSLSVHLEYGGYTCFACGETGDAWDLIMTREGLSFPDAVEFARDRLGIDHRGGRGAPRDREPWRPSWL